MSDPDVLLEVAASIGFDSAEVVEMLASGEREEIVRQKEQFWTSRGVRGVPAMIFERQHLVTGAQGEANYASILTQLVTPESVEV